MTRKTLTPPEAPKKSSSKASAVKKHIRGIRSATGAKPNGKPIRIPITNVYDGNDYTALLYVGSKNIPVNVILDTGSSTLAVKPSTYSAATDTDLAATSLAQLVLYGTGGWAGPVVQTSVSMGVGDELVKLSNIPLAITDVQQKGNFTGKVDGILGLAYNGLNDGYDFKAYLTGQRVSPPDTYPWAFPSHSFKKFTVQFQNLLQSQKIPDTPIAPYFDALEENNIVANKFAFYTLRSAMHASQANGAGSPNDALNKGFFILGGGEEETDLFTGAFVKVQVLHDLYYNTNLKAVQVAGCDAVAALPLQPKYKPYMISNSIVDSGTSCLALSADVMKAILESLQKLHPAFETLVKEAMSSSTGSIPASKLDLAKWPVITFILGGLQGEDVRLDCSPDTYWQVNAPAPGQAVFQIVGPGPQEDQNQSILGLPLMNNYYTVFDRSEDKNGVVLFAKIKQ
jgi:Eukaryotic aspartyl protease